MTCSRDCGHIATRASYHDHGEVEKDRSIPHDRPYRRYPAPRVRLGGFRAWDSEFPRGPARETEIRKASNPCDGPECRHRTDRTEPVRILDLPPPAMVPCSRCRSMKHHAPVLWGKWARDRHTSFESILARNLSKRSRTRSGCRVGIFPAFPGRPSGASVPVGFAGEQQAGTFRVLSRRGPYPDGRSGLRVCLSIRRERA
jgi:hypothetical protein